jgi:hypothetical protein
MAKRRLFLFVTVPQALAIWHIVRNPLDVFALKQKLFKIFTLKQFDGHQ